MACLIQTIKHTGRIVFLSFPASIFCCIQVKVFRGPCYIDLTDPEDGYLREYRFDREMAEALIMSARIAAGWFTEEELAAELIDDAVEEDVQPQTESVPL